MTTRHFPIREVDRRVFDALKNGTKKIETRAAGPKYKNVHIGDEAVFNCGDDTLIKKILDVHIFKNIPDLLKKYSIPEIAPWCTSEEDLTEVYYSFPGYRERIAQYGIIAMELE